MTSQWYDENKKEGKITLNVLIEKSSSEPTGFHERSITDRNPVGSDDEEKFACVEMKT